MTSTNLAPRESKPIILTTQNYESWSTLLKEELIVEGLWNTVSGIGSNADENSNALRKIQKVSGDFAKFIRQTDSAKDAWNYLRALHNQSKGVTVKSETICCTAPSCVKVDEEDEDNSPCNSGDQVGYRGPGKLHVLLSWFASNLLAIVRVDQIYREKLMHHQAHQLLRLLCNQVITFDYSEHEEFHVRSAIFKAAQCGTVEFIIEIANSCPNLIRIIDQHDQNIFHVAVKHRQEKIFNLIYKLGAEKANMACQTDDKGNHILHLAALLAPPERLRRVSGAALQLQRELQWFKEVEYITPPSHRNLKNAGGQIPHVLFRKQHNDLVEEGEKWMKDTATSSTVVATLIATVMFSAAFQVPGGNDDKGVPNFLHSRSFMLFAIADAFSLFSSITSALMFLYILTSRYAQEDFLRSCRRN